ncbi:MAG: putative glycoside hydrolase, partial [Chloroflexota bacterium]
MGVATLMLPAGAGARPLAGHARIAINTAVHDTDFKKTAARRDVVVLQEWERDHMRELKAANPRITVLMYKNLGAMTAAEFGNAGTGISTQQAEDHPEWYLRNTRGERFTFNDYGYLWAADIGNRDYQARWAANVSAKLAADDWDGVLIDDANPTMQYHYPV